MTHQKNYRTKPVPYNNKVNRFNKEDDTYGIFKQEIEVDTDVNEDPNRERLLDEINPFVSRIERRTIILKLLLEVD